MKNTDSFDRSIGVELARAVEHAIPVEVGLWPRVKAAIARRRGPSRRLVAVGLALLVLALSLLAVTPAWSSAADVFPWSHGPHAPVDHGPHAPVDNHHAR